MRPDPGGRLLGRKRHHRRACAFARARRCAAYDIQDVGEGIRVADVLDPFGNVFGIIENPNFKLPKRKSEMKRANGSFEVTVQPLSNAEVSDDSMLGRFCSPRNSAAISTRRRAGRCCPRAPPRQRSAGYVAIDQVTGTLEGRAGGFVLQHSGRMNRGVPRLSVTVVPDSGTGELAGLSGTLRIKSSTATFLRIPLFLSRH